VTQLAVTEACPRRRRGLIPRRSAPGTQTSASLHGQGMVSPPARATAVQHAPGRSPPIARRRTPTAARRNSWLPTVAARAPERPGHPRNRTV